MKIEELVLFNESERISGESVWIIRLIHSIITLRFLNQWSEINRKHNEWMCKAHASYYFKWIWLIIIIILKINVKYSSPIAKCKINCILIMDWCLLPSYTRLVVLHLLPIVLLCYQLSTLISFTRKNHVYCNIINILMKQVP